MGCVGDNLRLYVRNLKVLWGVLGPVSGCMSATYKSYVVCWSQFGAACWQPTSVVGCVGASLRLYVGNLQVLWGVLEPVCGCMLATYRSYGVCWIQFGAVCWQPTCLMGCVGASLRLYVGNLQVLWGVWSKFGGVCWQPGNLHVLWAVLEPVWGCRLATYKSYGVCWSHFGAVGRQRTSLMGCVGATLGLYAGSLQVLWGVWS